jgi:hypothetical protein
MHAHARTRARGQPVPIRSIRRAAQRRPMPTDSWRGGAGRGGRGRPGFRFVALIAFLIAVGNVALLSLVVVPLFSVSPTTASTPLLLSFLCAFVWWLRACLHCICRYLGRVRRRSSRRAATTAIRHSSRPFWLSPQPQLRTRTAMSKSSRRPLGRPPGGSSVSEASPCRSRTEI